MSEILSNPVVLPETLREISFAFGLTAEKLPQTVTFLYRANALTRANYANFIALLDAGAARAERVKNAALIADRENVTAALQLADKKPTKGDAAPKPAPEVARYARLDAAFSRLGADLDKARTLATVEGSEASFLDPLVEQLSLVKGFLAQMEIPDVRTEEEVEKAIEARRLAAIEENEARTDIAAKMLAHLCRKFHFIDEKQIEATPENLKIAFDAAFLEQVCKEIREDFFAPLARAGNTGA